MIMYADHNVPYYSDKDMKEIEKVLSQDLCMVSKWLQENELVLNLKKGNTEVMLFGTKKRLKQQGEHRSDVVWHKGTSKTTRT